LHRRRLDGPARREAIHKRPAPGPIRIAGRRLVASCRVWVVATPVTGTSGKRRFVLARGLQVRCPAATVRLVVHLLLPPLLVLLLLVLQLPLLMLLLHEVLIRKSRWQIPGQGRHRGRRHI
jgi:hypothetical protein